MQAIEGNQSDTKYEDTDEASHNRKASFQLGKT